MLLFIGCVFTTLSSPANSNSKRKKKSGGKSGKNVTCV